MSPAPPRLTLRVGFTGHRPDQLDASAAARLATEIDRVLGIVEASLDAVHRHPSRPYASDPRIVRILCALAEGADRIAARVALDRGHALACILPFLREEYVHDFRSSSSIEEFSSLLGRATSTIELDGVRGADADAYEEAGRLLLRHSDVLVAVWNGEPGRGGGGTANVVENAIAMGMPVVWIDSRAPHESLILETASQPRRNARPLNQIATDIEQTLLPPGGGGQHVAAGYYAGPATRRHVGVFRAFRALMEIGHSHEQHGEAAPDSGDVIETEHRWADRLANHFGELYRDSFVSNYLLGAFAVFAALVGFREPMAAVVELVLIALILVITYLGRRRRWHERWLGYRLLGEQFRHLRFLWPLACAPARMRSGAQGSGQSAETQWGPWMLQARIRELPMANARFDRTYLDECRARLIVAIDEQRHFHASSGERSRQLHHRLHAVGTFLFLATAAVCVVHLYVDAMMHHGSESAEASSLNWVLTTFAAGLPALGAAIAGIDNHAEFARMAERSRAMARNLADLSREIAGAGNLRSTRLSQMAERAAELMSAELLDWQFISWGRPITLPS